MSRLSVRTADRSSFNGKVELDGVDISGIVRSVTVVIDAGGGPPQASLVLAPDIIEYDGDVDFTANRDVFLRHKAPSRE
jgi:hypothetical protein